MGCGAGQILERLPPGSIGIEANPYLVEHLNQQGLTVIKAVDENGFNLSTLHVNKYETLILSHVLEHFARAGHVLSRLLQDCASLGIVRVIIVVPGFAGFKSDITHKTFVDWEYLCSHRMLVCEGYKIEHRSYFPGNFKILGKLFAYHEMMFRRAQHV